MWDQRLSTNKIAMNRGYPEKSQQVNAAKTENGEERLKSNKNGSSIFNKHSVYGDHNIERFEEFTCINAKVDFCQE